MKLFDSAEAMPSRVLAVLGCLLEFGAKRLTVDELEGLVSPIPLRGAPDDARMAHEVLNECIAQRLAVRQEEGGQVSPRGNYVALTARAPQALGKPPLEHAPLRRLVLDGLLCEGGDGDVGSPLVLAWFLAQDATIFAGDLSSFEQGVAPLTQRFAGAGVNVNDVIYGNLRRWLPYLGLATVRVVDRSERLVPDPTEAVAARLQEAFAGGKGAEQPLRTVLERLGRALPVLPGGWCYATLADALPRVEGGHVGPALSLALRRLEARGALSLSSRHDAAEGVVLAGEGTRTTHAAWLA
jgi:hypothetical protein